VSSAALAAAVGGYRIGFLARVTSWVGMLVGAIGGALVIPPILRNIEDPAQGQVLAITFGILLGSAFIGQAIGLVIGHRLRGVLPFGGLRQADRAAGALAGVIGVVLAFWLLLPIMADSQGWFALQSRTSSIADVVHERLPDPPDTLETLRRYVGEGQFPNVLGPLDAAPDVGPPPSVTGIAQSVVDAVVPSTVKVQGVACRRIQEGSGFVVGPDLVVTNAHVVAGESDTIVQRSDGSEVDATVVAFDPQRDLAILQAPGLDRPPLERDDIDDGGQGAVFGHPGGGALRAAPFEVAQTVRATGTDIYDNARIERQVLILAAGLQPGDSGAALIDPNGRVVGVAFAIAPDKSGVAYALDMSELDAVLEGALSAAVDTGPCLR